MIDVIVEVVLIVSVVGSEYVLDVSAVLVIVINMVCMDENVFVVDMIRVDDVVDVLVVVVDTV